jgi:hypothetical protein
MQQAAMTANHCNRGRIELWLGDNQLSGR